MYRMFILEYHEILIEKKSPISYQRTTHLLK